MHGHMNIKKHIYKYPVENTILHHHCIFWTRLHFTLTYLTPICQSVVMNAYRSGIFFQCYEIGHGHLLEYRFIRLALLQTNQKCRVCSGFWYLAPSRPFVRAWCSSFHVLKHVTLQSSRCVNRIQHLCLHSNKALRNGSHLDAVRHIILHARPVLLQYRRPDHDTPPEGGRPATPFRLWRGGWCRIYWVPGSAPPRYFRAVPLGRSKTVASPGARTDRCWGGPSPQQNGVFPPEAADAHEAVSELWRHKIVEDWVNGRVEIQHGSAEVQDTVVAL